MRGYSSRNKRIKAFHTTLENPYKEIKANDTKIINNVQHFPPSLSINIKNLNMPCLVDINESN